MGVIVQEYFCDDMGLRPSDDLGLIDLVALRSSSPTQLDLSLSNGLELYLWCRILFLLELSFLVLIASSVTFDTDEACFISQLYWSNNQLTVFSNRMKTNTKFLCSIIFWIFLLASSKSQLEEKANDNNPDAWELESVGYLRNVQRLDMLINFLHCNQTVGWDQLTAINAQLIHQSRQGHRQNTSDFSCESESVVEQPEKGACWLCQKKFKNNTYLAVHYLNRHQQSFLFHKKENPSTSTQDITAMQMILRERLYRLIGPNQLQTLFSSLALHEQINQYCTYLFQVVFQHYAKEQPPSPLYSRRYESFMKAKNSREICMMIALKMYEDNIWIDIGRYVGLTILLFCGVTASVYFYTHKIESQRNSQFRKKSKRW